MWGEVLVEPATTQVVRFVLSDSVVSLPIAQLRRWEHTAGPPETLTITAGSERITVHGERLADVRHALDALRLVELRVHPARAGARPGPCVRRITIEPL